MVDFLLHTVRRRDHDPEWNPEGIPFYRKTPSWNSEYKPKQVRN